MKQDDQASQYINTTCTWRGEKVELFLSFSWILHLVTPDLLVIIEQVKENDQSYNLIYE